MIKHLIQSQIKFEKNSRSKFFQRQFDLASNLYSKDLKAHFSCVNAIEYSNSCELLASGILFLILKNFLIIIKKNIIAGDDKRLLLWNVSKNIVTDCPNTQQPIVMKGQHNSNIFTLEFDNEDQKIFSGIILKSNYFMCDFAYIILQSLILGFNFLS